MNENWKTIPFEPNYEVSDLGNVRNLKKQNKKLRLDKYGYSRVTLYPSGKTYSVHRLVMLTFEPNRNLEFNVVNHKNGDKQNNKLTNLEWTNCSGNARHRDTVLQSKWKGTLNPSAKLTYGQAFI